MNTRTMVWEAMLQADTLHRALTAVAQRLETTHRVAQAIATLASGAAVVALLADKEHIPELVPKIVSAIAFAASIVNNIWSFRDRARDALSLAEQMSEMESRLTSAWSEYEENQTHSAAAFRELFSEWSALKKNATKHLRPASALIDKAQQDAYRARGLGSPQSTTAGP